MTALAFENVTIPVIAPVTEDIVFDETDAALLGTAIRYRTLHFRPLVGDYVILADRSVQRIGYANRDRFNITAPYSKCSFHLYDVGTMSCSGAFPESIHRDNLIPLGYRRSASCWMWHHNRSGGGRGVDVIVPVAVWQEVRP